MADTVFVRTKRKGTEFVSDLHHFTNKWQEIPVGEVRSSYTAEPNLEISEDRKGTPVEKPLEEKTVVELKAEAGEAGIEVPKDAKKDDIIAALET